MKKAMAVLITMVTAAVITVGYVDKAEAGSRDKLTLATTTSLYDTGLLGHLKPMFEKKYNVDLHIISAGTGKAIRFAKAGDVDLLLVHCRAREDKFVADGYGVNRRCIAYNNFLIVGPPGDPATVKGMSPEDAVRTIKKKGIEDLKIRFVSRGDDSGTHAREQSIWRSAGYDYEAVRAAGPWYIESGRGMGATLMMTNEKSAYTVVDIGTFLAFKGDIDLVPIVEEGDILLNPYGVIAVNPERHLHVNFKMANNFINFLMSDDVQKAIGEFGLKEYGRPLFFPIVGGCREIGCPTWEECAKPAE